MTEGRPRIRITRDAVLFATGLALLINEAVIRHGPERPYLLVMYAGMMGLPVFLRTDEKRNPPPPGGSA